MKDKIIFLIIGILLGAILTTTGFLIYDKVNSNNETTNTTMQMGTPPDGGNMIQNGGTPPSGGMQGNMTPPDMQGQNSTTATSNTTNE